MKLQLAQSRSSGMPSRMVFMVLVTSSIFLAVSCRVLKSTFFVMKITRTFVMFGFFLYCRIKSQPTL